MEQKCAPFAEVHAFACALNLRNEGAWNNWCGSGARPSCVPISPETCYDGKGWQGWDHWLGVIHTAEAHDDPDYDVTSGHYSSKHNAAQFAQFEEAHAYARSLSLKGVKEWHAWSKSGKRPVRIPSNPGVVYKYTGWRGFVHWLRATDASDARPEYQPRASSSRGGNKKSEFAPFDEALAMVRSSKLQSMDEWAAWAASPTRYTAPHTCARKTSRFSVISLCAHHCCVHYKELLWV